MKSNLNKLKAKLSKKQILDALKAKNIKGGGTSCPPPGDWRSCPPPGDWQTLIKRRNFLHRGSFSYFTDVTFFRTIKKNSLFTPPSPFYFPFVFSNTKITEPYLERKPIFVTIITHLLFTTDQTKLRFNVQQQHTTTCRSYVITYNISSSDFCPKE